MRRAIATPVTLIVATALAGCNLTPHYERGALPVPPSWPIGDAYLAQSEAKLPAVTYAQVFTDPRLQAIIRQALANNRDLRVAAANIIAQRAQYRIQRADLFPTISANGQYSYAGGGNGARATATSSTAGGTGSTTGTGTTGTTGTGNTGTGATGTGATGTGATGTSAGSVVSSTAGSAFSADIGTTAFEIDLFGRVRSLTSAALNRYLETEAAARATRLTLVAEIANGWLTYAADQSLLKIAKDTEASAERTVTLTNAQLQGGIAPRTNLREAQQTLYTAQSSLAAQRTAIAQDINGLQLLVGATVDPKLLPASIEEGIGSIATLPAGLDSTILLRRPDVVQAEYELRATNAQIGAARAVLFPRLTLTGLAGFASSALSSLFTGGAFSYSAAPSLTYPIFQAGAARAGVTYSKAQRDVALATYEKTIQTAFEETANALARLGTISDQLGADRNNVIAATDAYQLTNASFRGGVGTFLDALVAQRTLFSVQQALVATQLTAAQNRVTLYQVLGGDSTLETTAAGPKPVTASGAPRIDDPQPDPAARPTR
ncbi:efflux transporter outer membrane subunit [Sphingomonas bacterium]|uniref:efflux transporter outer membrane subunit n=1 Tax=Sphingomonas bacterium TaxID=1895847 RepID=UPI001575A587|nr:efflux transporter outer membrane subunit [Sphingomonas bacterium]